MYTKGKYNKIMVKVVEINIMIIYLITCNLQC